MWNLESRIYEKGVVIVFAMKGQDLLVYLFSPPRLTMIMWGNRCRITTHTHTHSHSHLQYDSAEWEPAFLRQAREFLFFPLLPREASKRVLIFDRGTGSKPEGLRSGFLQADLSLIGCARSHALSLSQKKKKAQKFSPPAAGETPDPG